MKLALLFVFIGLAVVFNHFSIGYGLPTPDFGTDLQRAVEDAARGAQRAAEDGYNTVRDTLNGDSNIKVSIGKDGISVSKSSPTQEQLMYAGIAVAAIVVLCLLCWCCSRRR